MVILGYTDAGQRLHILLSLLFLLGAMCSGIAGYLGTWVSVHANVRVSSAARRSAREALQVFFSPHT